MHERSNHRTPHHEYAHHHHEGGPPWARHWRGGMFFGPPWAGGRRARKGDVRTALLSLLADRSMHGYDLIRELEERSGGMWRPSPGSIYPTLQMLEDEGLVTSQEQDGKRVYSLTDAGKEEVRVRRERSGGAEPWEWGSVSEAAEQLRQSAFQLGAAVMQVVRAAAEPEMKRVAEILTEAKRKVYAVLAGEG